MARINFSSGKMYTFDELYDMFKTAPRSAVVRNPDTITATNYYDAAYQKTEQLRERAYTDARNSLIVGGGLAAAYGIQSGLQFMQNRPGKGAFSGYGLNHGHSYFGEFSSQRPVGDPRLSFKGSPLSDSVYSQYGRGWREIGQSALRSGSQGLPIHRIDSGPIFKPSQTFMGRSGFGLLAAGGIVLGSDAQKIEDVATVSAFYAAGSFLYNKVAPKLGRELVKSGDLAPFGYHLGGDKGFVMKNGVQTKVFPKAPGVGPFAIAASAGYDLIQASSSDPISAQRGYEGFSGLVGGGAGWGLGLAAASLTGVGTIPALGVATLTSLAGGYGLQSAAARNASPLYAEAIAHQRSEQDFLRRMSTVGGQTLLSRFDKPLTVAQALASPASVLLDATFGAAGPVVGFPSKVTGLPTKFDLKKEFNSLLFMASGGAGPFEGVSLPDRFAAISAAAARSPASGNPLLGKTFAEGLPEGGLAGVLDKSDTRFFKSIQEHTAGLSYGESSAAKSIANYNYYANQAYWLEGLAKSRQESVALHERQMKAPILPDADYFKALKSGDSLPQVAAAAMATPHKMPFGLPDLYGTAVNAQKSIINSVAGLWRGIRGEGKLQELKGDQRETEIFAEVYKNKQAVAASSLNASFGGLPALLGMTPEQTKLFSGRPSRSGGVSDYQAQMMRERQQAQQARLISTKAWAETSAIPYAQIEPIRFNQKEYNLAVPDSRLYSGADYYGPIGENREKVLTEASQLFQGNLAAIEKERSSYRDIYDKSIASMSKISGREADVLEMKARWNASDRDFRKKINDVTSWYENFKTDIDLADKAIKKTRQDNANFSADRGSFDAQIHRVQTGLSQLGDEQYFNRSRLQTGVMRRDRFITENYRIERDKLAQERSLADLYMTKEWEQLAHIIPDADPGRAEQLRAALQAKQDSSTAYFSNRERMLSPYMERVDRITSYANMIGRYASPMMTSIVKGIGTGNISGVLPSLYQQALGGLADFASFGASRGLAGLYEDFMQQVKKPVMNTHAGFLGLTGLSGFAGSAGNFQTVTTTGLLGAGGLAAMSAGPGVGAAIAGVAPFAGKGVGMIKAGVGAIKGAMTAHPYMSGLAGVGIGAMAASNLYPMLDQNYSQRNGMVGSGFGGVAGALLGSMIAPGVGTFVGGGLGAFAGGAAGMIGSRNRRAAAENPFLTQQPVTAMDNVMMYGGAGALGGALIGGTIAGLLTGGFGFMGGALIGGAAGGAAGGLAGLFAPRSPKGKMGQAGRRAYQDQVLAPFLRQLQSGIDPFAIGFKMDHIEDRMRQILGVKGHGSRGQRMLRDAQLNFNKLYANLAPHRQWLEAPGGIQGALYDESLRQEIKINSLNPFISQPVTPLMQQYQDLQVNIGQYGATSSRVNISRQAFTAQYQNILTQLNRSIDDMQRDQGFLQQGIDIGDRQRSVNYDIMNRQLTNFDRDTQIQMEGIMGTLQRRDNIPALIKRLEEERDFEKDILQRRFGILVDSNALDADKDAARMVDTERALADMLASRDLLTKKYNELLPTIGSSTDLFVRLNQAIIDVTRAMNEFNNAIR